MSWPAAARPTRPRFAADGIRRAHSAAQNARHRPLILLYSRASTRVARTNSISANWADRLVKNVEEVIRRTKADEDGTDRFVEVEP
jgi:hypothetical protein